MLAGAICTTVAAILTAYKTGNVLLWPCAGAIILIGAARSLDMHFYLRRKVRLKPSEATYWEVRYQVGAVLYAAAQGVWGAVTLLGSDDPVAHLLCTTVTIGHIAAGSGRAYGRPWIFHLQILLACGPMSVALALHGDP